MTAPDLPHGWTWATLESVAVNARASITDGPFGSNLKSEHYTETGPRVVRLQNIGEGLFAGERAHISQEHFGRLRKHEVLARDVLVAMLGEVLPRACVAPLMLGPAIVKADCVRARIEDAAASPLYITYALNCDQTRRQAAAIVHGVGRPRLNLGELKALWLPLAPRAEQNRIVSAIEQHLSDIDAGVAALERVLLKLKSYRASVLKDACEGRLVPTEAELARKEGRVYEPASLLLRHILTERRAQWEADQLAKMKAKGQEPRDDRWKEKYPEPSEVDTSKLPPLSEGWIWTTIETVGQIVLGRRRAPEYVEGEDGRVLRPYLRSANVRTTHLDLSDVLSMPFNDHELKLYRLEPGDIILTEGQSPELVGLSAVYPGGVDDLCIQATVHRFRAHRGVSVGFAQTAFKYSLLTGVFMRAASLTVNIAHLTSERLKPVPFPLPPQREQERIVAEVDRLLSVADETEREVRAQLARAKNLRHAVLKRAFEGKLVPQDPTDEPASALLARLRQLPAPPAPTPAPPAPPRPRAKRAKPAPSEGDPPQA